MNPNNPAPGRPASEISAVTARPRIVIDVNEAGAVQVHIDGVHSHVEILGMLAAAQHAVSLQAFAPKPQSGLVLPRGPIANGHTRRR